MKHLIFVVFSLSFFLLFLFLVFLFFSSSFVLFLYLFCFPPFLLLLFASLSRPLSFTFPVYPYSSFNIPSSTNSLHFPTLVLILSCFTLSSLISLLPFFLPFRSSSFSSYSSLSPLILFFLSFLLSYIFQLLLFYLISPSFTSSSRSPSSLLLPSPPLLPLFLPFFHLLFSLISLSSLSSSSSSPSSFGRSPTRWARPKRPRACTCSTAPCSAPFLETWRPRRGSRSCSSATWTPTLRRPSCGCRRARKRLGERLDFVSFLRFFFFFFFLHTRGNVC